MKNVLKTVIFLSIFFILFTFWVLLMRPDTTIFDGRNENSNIVEKGFKKLPENCLDYIAVGSSNVFMDISPVEIWNNYGLCGYDYVSPMQPLYISEYYLKDAFKTQSPKIVLLDAMGIAFYEHAADGYTHLGMDYKALSKDKVNVLDSVPYENNLYLFDFMQYHARWNELSKSDFNLLEYNASEDFLGYTPAYLSNGFDESLLLQEGADIQIPESTKAYFENIVRLCEKNDCALVVIKTPLVEWTRKMKEATQALCDEYNITYIDTNEYVHDIGLDTTMDFCDTGGHLNEDGAKKVSNYLAEYMMDFCEFEMQKPEEIKQYFDERKNVYEHFKQISELKCITDGETYLNNIVSGDYDVMIAADLTDKDNIEEILKKALNIKNKSKKLCILKTKNGITVKKKQISKGDYYIKFNENIDNPGNVIQYNYLNYSKNGGVDIVVYDPFYDAIIDTVSLAQGEEGISVVR